MFSLCRLLTDRRSLAVAGGVAFLVTPLCGWLFSCGCDWPWHGLAAHCSYFDPTAPHNCPWCEHGLLSTAAILLATAAGIAVAHRTISSAKRRSSSAVAAVAGLAVALATLLLAGTLTLTVTG
ncbi:hypothetical protein ACW73L_10495 [Methylolobus aquaticus]